MQANNDLEFIDISDSLRAGSYNSTALRATTQLLPAGVLALEIADISAIPLYNDDVKVMIASAQGRFDAEGRLTDQPTREHIGRLLQAFARPDAAAERPHHELTRLRSIE